MYMFRKEDLRRDALLQKGASALWLLHEKPSLLLPTSLSLAIHTSREVRHTPVFLLSEPHLGPCSWV